jgi:small-conductance mechanosensitive channel
VKDPAVLDRALITIGSTRVTPALLGALALVAVATWIGSWLLRRLLNRGLNRLSVREGTAAATGRLVHYAVLAVGLAAILELLGVDLKTLFAASAVFAIGIGFAMQNITQNFVSGLILLLERSIKPGDVLEVEGRFVRVHEMGIRATIARTLDEEEIIIPNSTIVQSTVKNYTLRSSVYRLRASVGVVYGSDMALVRRTLESVASKQPGRVPDKDPLVLMAEFGDSSVVFEVSIWIDDPWQMRRTKSALHEAIWWAFKEEGIVIAFPQLDVHLDPGVVDRLAAPRGAERPRWNRAPAHAAPEGDRPPEEP